MRRFVLAAALAMVAQASVEAASRLNVVIQPEPPSLMTGLVQNAPTQMVGGSIYESLLRYDKDLKPQASLAKEWSVSADGLTYTFKLQTSVKWHDGKPFSADDVVFSADKFLRETN